MKPAGARLKLLPRTARRKLSTASVYTTQSSPLYFDVLPQTSQPSGSSSSHSGGPPRILKCPSQPTTAITHYSPPPTHQGSSSSVVAHPKYTTNSSHAYPGGNGLPPVWFVPTATNSGRSEIERRLPWEGPSEGKGKDRRTFSLEMGAYGIPKRRKNQSSEELDQQQQQQRNGDLRLSASAPTSSALSSPAASAGMSKEDPASYSLAVQVGEDAYFLRPDALGVADGVGGWKHKGESNSALFAKKLMHFCSYELARQQYPTPPPSNASTPTPTTTTTSSSSSAPLPTSGPDPVQILQTSYERCIQDAKQSGMLGSSTATLAVLADSELRIAHVGDCVVCVVRDGEMVFRSEEMQHSFNYPYQLGPRSDTTPATHAQRLTVPVRANDIVILASDGMGDNLWDEDVLDEINRFIRTTPSSSPSPSTPPQSGSLSFSASSSTPTTASTSPPLRTAHAPAGPVTNTVLAQRLSEALASRAKRVSERRAMTADASGTMGAFAPKRMVIPPMPKGPPPPPPSSNRSASTTSTPLPIPPRPAQTQTPTPPPSPLMKPIPVIEGMEMPIHRSITQSDGQLDDDVVLGDGFGGDGEYGGAGLGGFGFEEEEEPEWVRDEIPFGRKAREAGVRFVGGKGDDISVLVAIISSVPEPTTEPPVDEPFHASSAMEALAKLRLNATI